MSKKVDYPVSDIRHYLEPGPIVLVTSRWQDETDVMTLGWHTVMEFTPNSSARARTDGSRVPIAISPLAIEARKPSQT